MTANELRVGNWISDKSASNKGMWQVKELRVKLCFYGSFYGNYGSLKPIPLTPEILLASGIFFKPPEWVKSVHEFQNWYYWTNNKQEIEIKFT